jgi:Xaa-Pro aminopeptidase
VLSLREKSRRYRLVQDKLWRQGLAGLLVISNGQINQQGFVRYFTNLPIPIYSHALIFLPKDEPFLFTPSPLQTFWAKRLSWIPKSRIKISRDFGQDMAKLILKIATQGSTWGVINLNTMTAKDYMAIGRLCPKLKLVEAAGLLEDVRSQKTKEELKLVQQSAELAQLSHQIFFREMKMGIKERELVAKVEKALRENGAERTFYLISSNSSNIYPYLPGDNVLDSKSPVLFSTEVSGPGGYWTQMVRTFFGRKPKGILMDMYKALEEIRKKSEKELRPGRRISKVAEKLRRLIQERGFEFGIHFGHGLGLDVVEEPLISVTNNRTLMPNQIITIHPHLILEKRSLGIWMGDTYLIGEKETKNLTPYLPGDF